MSDVVHMSGRLLLFDKVDRNGYIWPKDCTLEFPEKIPVAWDFKFTYPEEIHGFATVIKDDKGLICDVELYNCDYEELGVGGMYCGVDKHRKNEYLVIDKAKLCGIGIGIVPADDELKIFLKGE